jgi:hypothetical protein
MLADRLRLLAEPRLLRPLPPFASGAEAARHVAQQLADAALGIAARAAPEPPAWRDVPPAGPFAAGDQIAVTGHDLAEVLRGVGGSELVWTRSGRRTAGDVVAVAREALVRLRLAL